MFINVSLAVLYVEDKFLIQLRDDIPGIVYPGHWGLFGGHIENNESPEEAIKRELIEEIGHEVDCLELYSIYQDENRLRYVFSAPLKIPIEEIVLGEGLDYALVGVYSILKGEHYSEVAERVYPFVPSAKKILLDFLAKAL